MKLVSFSPTGTTRKIIQHIAQGINHDTVELLDLTKPGARKQNLETSKDELLIVGVPVYLGRVPALLLEWLHAINAHGSPVVCVVVYGNRAYEDALIELTDILADRGCIPIAGAAYIGEHSYSSSETPIAAGRPDERDLHHAEIFGREIFKKLRSVSSIDPMTEKKIPGNCPCEEVIKLWSVDFIAISNDCTQCGTCAEGCPVGAIDPENSNLIDKEKCITCSACIRNCPNKARTMKLGPVKDAALRLGRLYQERKEPVYFI